MNRTVSGYTDMYAILGDPIVHAMSPVLMNSNFERNKLDKIFLALKTNLSDFKQIFEVLMKLNFQGYVFTMPVKQIAIPYMDILSEEASIIGAINCAVKKEGKLIGSNTDSIGFWTAVQEANIKNYSLDKVFVLGCGGFSKAAIAQAALQGVSEIVVANKFEDRSFINDFYEFQERLYKSVDSTTITLIDWIPDLWVEHLPEVDLVANGTPNGMGNEGDLHEIFPFDSVNKNALFFDAIYHPRETKFLKMAKSKDHICIEGLDLLVHQGTVSFNNYTNIVVEPSVMKDDILEFWKQK